MLEKIFSWLRDGVLDSLYSILGSFVGVLSVFAIFTHVRPLDTLHGWLEALVIPDGWLNSVDTVLASGTPWGWMGVTLAFVGALGMATHDVCRGRSGPTFWFGASLMVTAGMNWLWLILLLIAGFIVSMVDLRKDSSITDSLKEALWRLGGTVVVTLSYGPLEVFGWFIDETPSATRQQIITPDGRPLKIELVGPKPGATEARRKIQPDLTPDTLQFHNLGGTIGPH